MSKITEKTLIPISLVFTVVGGVFWLTQIYFTGNANAKSITEIREAQVDHNARLYDILMRIDQRLSRIEGQLNNK